MRDFNPGLSVNPTSRVEIPRHFSICPLVDFNLQLHGEISTPEMKLCRGWNFIPPVATRDEKVKKVKKVKKLKKVDSRRSQRQTIRQIAHNIVGSTWDSIELSITINFHVIGICFQTQGRRTFSECVKSVSQRFRPGAENKHVCHAIANLFQLG